MGETTVGLGLSQEKNSKGLSAARAVSQLGADVATLRGELGDLVTELDNRRRELLDLRLQARRHVIGVAVGVASLVGAVAGLISLGVWRARQRRRLLSRATQVHEALGRMISQRDGMGAPPPALKTIFTAAATAAVPLLIGRLLGSSTRRRAD